MNIEIRNISKPLCALFNGKSTSCIRNVEVMQCALLLCYNRRHAHTLETAYCSKHTQKIQKEMNVYIIAY